MTILEKRQKIAIDKIGGPVGLLNLPSKIKEVLKSTKDLETKVKLLEEIANAL